MTSPSRYLAGGLVAAAVAVVLLYPWSAPHVANPRSAVGPGAQPAGTAPVGLDPAHFPPGSCVALQPTSGDRHRTVFLDAGHGGPDPGAADGVTDSGQYVDEKSVTLPVTLDAADLLRAQGFRVVLSRTTDSSVAALTPADVGDGVLTTEGEHKDLIARVTCANLSGAAALVSVHFDAYPDPSADGATTLYDTARPFSAANQALAGALQQAIVAGLAAAGWQVPDRGISDDGTAGGGEITDAGTEYGHLDLLGPVDPGYVDDPTTMPGALVEPLFLTDPDEAAIAVDPAAQQAIAAGIADGVAAFLRTPQ